MASIPIWAIGKHVTSVVMTPQSVSSAGVLSATTPVMTLTGYWDEIDIESENTTEMIQAADTRRENEVITGSRTTVRVTEILKSNDAPSTPTNLLCAIAYGASDYYKIVLARAGLTFTFYGLVKSYRESLRRGKQTGVMELTMIDPGVANPAIT